MRSAVENASVRGAWPLADGAPSGGTLVSLRFRAGILHGGSLRPPCRTRLGLDRPSPRPSLDSTIGPYQDAQPDWAHPW